MDIEEIIENENFKAAIDRKTLAKYKRALSNSDVNLGDFKEALCEDLENNGKKILSITYRNDDMHNLLGKSVLDFHLWNGFYFFIDEYISGCREVLEDQIKDWRERWGFAEWGIGLEKLESYVLDLPKLLELSKILLPIDEDSIVDIDGHFLKISDTGLVPANDPTGS
jgi:hypothetical protein